MERVIAQRIQTGEFLSWDVPLDGTSVREAGPGGLRGTIAPVYRDLLADDGLPLLREWSTALYHEVEGEIRGAGIVARIGETDEGDLTVEAPGFSSYPHGMVYNGQYPADVDEDCLDAVRKIWGHLQSFPDGDLGLVIDTTTSGTLAAEEEEENDKTVLKPYRIRWWEYRDCGREIDDLLDKAPGQYAERHTWNADHTAIEHRLVLGSPRIGRKRGDLRFVEGENVIEAIPLLVDGDEFAQNIYGVGRGEGRKIRHHAIEQRDDRLRRTHVLIDKEAGQGRIERLTRREYHRRSEVKDFEEVVVRDHPNARISDIHPGDDILVEANLRWYGRTRLWVRVLEIEQRLTGDDTATLQVMRSEAFRY